MRKTGIVLILLSILAAGCDSEMSKIHVNDQIGDDANPGTSEAPLQSLERALTVAVKRNAKQILICGNQYGNWTVIDTNLTVSGGWDTNFTRVIGESIMINEKEGRTVTLSNCLNVTLKDVVVTSGVSEEDIPENGLWGGIEIVNSEKCNLIAVISNNYNRMNDVSTKGGGIFCFRSDRNYFKVNVIDNSAYRGGGIAVDQSKDNIFKGTVSSNQCYTNDSDGKGGGIYVSQSTNNDLYMEISYNVSSYGGGLYMIKSSEQTFDGSIGHNIASRLNAYGGGGVYSYQSDMNVFKSDIISNTSFGYGGGIYVSGNDNEFQATISFNTANNYGGGVYLTGTNNILNETIANNSAKSGGGIYLYSAENNDVSGNIVSNHAIQSGGGIYLYDTTNNSIRSDLAYNIAGLNGGGLNIYGSQFDEFNLKISDCLAKSNGGAVYMYSSYIQEMMKLELINNKAYFNGGGIYAYDNDIDHLNITAKNNIAGITGGALYAVLCSIKKLEGSIEKNQSFSNPGYYVDRTNNIKEWKVTLNNNTDKYIMKLPYVYAMVDQVPVYAEDDIRSSTIGYLDKFSGAELLDGTNDQEIGVTISDQTIVTKLIKVQTEDGSEGWTYGNALSPEEGVVLYSKPVQLGTDIEIAHPDFIGTSTKDVPQTLLPGFNDPIWYAVPAFPEINDIVPVEVYDNGNKDLYNQADSRRFISYTKDVIILVNGDLIDPDTFTTDSTAETEIVSISRNEKAQSGESNRTNLYTYRFNQISSDGLDFTIYSTSNQIMIETENQSQKLWNFSDTLGDEYIKFNTDIIWIGDMDDDDRSDVILRSVRIDKNKEVSRYALYVSSYADEEEILGLADSFQAEGLP